MDNAHTIGITSDVFRSFNATTYNTTMLNTILVNTATIADVSFSGQPCYYNILYHLMNLFYYLLSVLILIIKCCQPIAGAAKRRCDALIVTEVCLHLAS